MRFTLKKLAVAMVLGIALAAAAPASALTTQTTILDVDFTFVYGPGQLCSFPVTFEQGPGKVKIVDFFDANGQLVKEHITNYGGVFHSTLSANGVTLTTVQTFSDFLTFNPDGSIANIADAGINFVFTLPHEGAIFLVVGLIRFDSNFNPIFTAGPGFATEPDIDALCSALS